MKILFTIPNFDTAGSGKAVLKVAQNLDRKKFEPHIMCMHDRGDYYKVVEKSGIPVHIAQYTTPMKPYIKGLWNCFKISKKFKKIAPDIIHSFHYSADYSEPLSAKMAGITWVYTKKNMNWGGKSKNGWKLRTLLAKAIAIQNRDMKREFFHNSLKTFLIPRGVDTTEFRPQLPVMQLRKLWKIEDDERILMCIANLVPIKGIEIALRAFASASKTHRDWRFMIVGDSTTTYAKEMVVLAKKLGIGSKVVFTGKQSKISDYLSISEVFVLSTLNEGRREGSPVSLLEAMACGKYVLASNISGIKDQLQDFPFHMFNPGDCNDLKIKLASVFAKTKEELKSEGYIFQKHVVQNYTLEREVVNTENLYRKLL